LFFKLSFLRVVKPRYEAWILIAASISALLSNNSLCGARSKLLFFFVRKKNKRYGMIRINFYLKTQREIHFSSCIKYKLSTFSCIYSEGLTNIW